MGGFYLFCSMSAFLSPTSWWFYSSTETQRIQAAPLLLMRLLCEQYYFVHKFRIEITTLLTFLIPAGMCRLDQVCAGMYPSFKRSDGKHSNQSARLFGVTAFQQETSYRHKQKLRVHAHRCGWIIYFVIHIMSANNYYRALPI